MIPWEVMALAEALASVAKDGEWRDYIDSAYQLFDELSERGITFNDLSHQVAT